MSPLFKFFLQLVLLIVASAWATAMFIFAVASVPA